MSRFSPLQKKVAFALVGSAKSVDELSLSLNITLAELNDALRQMLKLGLVKLEGYPQKYRLADAVIEGVRRRKEIAEKDPFELRLKAVIEFKGVEESFLAKHIGEVEEKLRKQKNFTIYNIYKAPPLKDRDHYSAYLEVNLSAKDFTSIVEFMYFFGPTSVEVLKPKKVVLAMDDLQEALMEMAQMIQSYNEAMLKSMAKDELAEFAKNLYMPKKED